MTRLELGNPKAIGDLTLVIIERLSTNADHTANTFWLNARKEPYALVMGDNRGLRALDMTGQQLVIEELTEAVPGLIEFIAQVKET